MKKTILVALRNIQNENIAAVATSDLWRVASILSKHGEVRSILFRVTDNELRKRLTADEYVRGCNNNYITQPA